MSAMLRWSTRSGWAVRIARKLSSHRPHWMSSFGALCPQARHVRANGVRPQSRRHFALSGASNGGRVRRRSLTLVGYHIVTREQPQLVRIAKPTLGPTTFAFELGHRGKPSTPFDDGMLAARTEMRHFHFQQCGVQGHPILLVSGERSATHLGAVHPKRRAAMPPGLRPLNCFLTPDPDRRPSRKRRRAHQHCATRLWRPIPAALRRCQ